MRLTSAAVGLLATIAVPGNPIATADAASAAAIQQAGLVRNNTIVVDGIQRTYHYYRPGNSGARALPLIFLVHGHGGSADAFSGHSGTAAPFKLWMELAESQQLMLVYPNGTLSPDNRLGWNDCRGDATTNPASDDVAFIRRLIQHFRANFNVDPRRVYAAGLSNGGHLSLRLAIELSNEVAAVGAVAAAMPANSKCAKPTRPISVLLMNGTADKLSPYHGGQIANTAAGRGSVLSTPASVRFWTGFNQTDPVAAVSDLPDRDPRDNSTVRRHRYSGGAERTEVVLYEIRGGGHSAPSIRQPSARASRWLRNHQNHDIETATVLWSFFKDKRR